MASDKINEEQPNTREELFRLVWSMPSEQVAVHLGISGVALGKRCAKLAVPKPPRGYWAKYKNRSERPVPPLAAYQDSVRARINRQPVQPGLHLSQRRMELFKKAADKVLSDNPELGRYEIRGSRLINIDPALATAALTSAINHFQDYLPETPFVAARQVTAGLSDVLLPKLATYVLVFPKSENSVCRTSNEFILVRISDALQRHIADAHRLIEKLQLAFTAIPLNSLEYCQSIRFVLSPTSQVISKADICVSATDAWLRIEQQSPLHIYETLPVPIKQLTALACLSEKSPYTHTDPEVRIYREDWELLQSLMEAEDIHEIASSVVYDLQDQDLQAKLIRAMKLWWPAEQFQALQVLQDGLGEAENRIEQWESELAIAKQKLCTKILGIRLGNILQVMRQGIYERIHIERLDFFKYEHSITFTAHGKRVRKDGVIGKRRDTLYLKLPHQIAYELTGHSKSREPARQPLKTYPFYKWSWQR